MDPLEAPGERPKAPDCPVGGSRTEFVGVEDHPEIKDARLFTTTNAPAASAMTLARM